MKLVKWALVASATTAVIFISGCQTSTKQRVQVATNDRIEVQEQKYQPIEAAQKRLALGLKYMETGYMERAKLNLIKAYEHAPDLPDVLFGLAYYYQHVFEYNKADSYYQKVLDKEPRNPDYLNAYGAFLCEAKNDYQGGVDYFLKAISQPSYTMVGAAYENAGFCSLKGGNKTAAEQYFEKALTLNPNLTKSLYGLSSVYFESNNYNRAEAYLLRFEGKGKPTADSLLLGYKIGRRLNDQVAINSYGQKLMQLFPNSEQTQTYLRMR